MDAKDGRQGRQEGATATKISYVFGQEKYSHKVREFRKLLTVANMPGLTR